MKKYSVGFANGKAVILYNDKIVGIETTVELLNKYTAVKRALNPMLWDRELSDAWHKNIPDMRKAFAALRDAAGRMQSTIKNTDTQ